MLLVWKSFRSQKITMNQTIFESKKFLRYSQGIIVNIYPCQKYTNTRLNIAKISSCNFGQNKHKSFYLQKKLVYCSLCMLPCMCASAWLTKGLAFNTCYTLKYRLTDVEYKMYDTYASLCIHMRCGKQF